MKRRHLSCLSGCAVAGLLALAVWARLAIWNGQDLDEAAAAGKALRVSYLLWRDPGLLPGRHGGGASLLRRASHGLSEAYRGRGRNGPWS